MALAEFRREYAQRGLAESDLAADPFAQFQKWFDEAVQAGQPDVNAMTLATADAEGNPSARIVLLKGVEEDGFVFFTNYESQKGRELADRPNAAVVFYWHEVERQVRAVGRVARIDRAATEAYFRTRPRGSQLGAWVSEQSVTVPGRAALEERLARLEAQFDGKEIPAPPFWGGFRLTPAAIEFWQGRPNRLHDRLRYRQSDAGWRIDRLSP